MKTLRTVLVLPLSLNAFAGHGEEKVKGEVKDHDHKTKKK